MHPFICVVDFGFTLGWRRYMEDASVTISPFTYKNYSLFAVFDGHGGKY